MTDTRERGAFAKAGTSRLVKGREGKGDERKGGEEKVEGRVRGQGEKEG